MDDIEIHNVHDNFRTYPGLSKTVTLNEFQNNSSTLHRATNSLSSYGDIYEGSPLGNSRQ